MIETAERLEPMGAGALFREALKLYRQNFALFGGLVALLAVPQTIVLFLLTAIGALFAAQIVLAATSIIVTGGISVAIFARYLEQPIGLTEAYTRPGGHAYWRLIGALIVVSLLVVLGLVLLIVPGIYLLIRFLFVPQAVMIEDAGVGDALSRSGRLVRGNWWRVFGVMLAFGIPVSLITIVIEAMLPLHVAIIFQYLIIPVLLLPLTWALVTLLYSDLRVRQGGPGESPEEIRRMAPAETAGSGPQSNLLALAVLILLGVAAAYTYRAIKTNSLPALQTVSLCATPHASESELTAATGVIQDRLDAFGIVHSDVTAGGGQCLRVGIPKSATQQGLSVLLPPGVVAIADGGSKALPTGRKVMLVCPSTLPQCAPNASVGSTKIEANPPVLQVVVSDAEIQRGSASDTTDQAGFPTVRYSMTQAGADRWCRFTTNNVGGYVPIVLDNRVVIDPQIESAICGSQSEITLGQGGTTGEAKRIASYLNFGAYPGGIHFEVKR